MKSNSYVLLNQQLSNKRRMNEHLGHIFEFCRTSSSSNLDTAARQEANQ